MEMVISALTIPTTRLMETSVTKTREREIKYAAFASLADANVAA
jgi:hypothetical protein